MIGKLYFGARVRDCLYLLHPNAWGEEIHRRRGVGYGVLTTLISIHMDKTGNDLCSALVVIITEILRNPISDLTLDHVKDVIPDIWLGDWEVAVRIATLETKGRL